MNQSITKGISILQYIMKNACIMSEAAKAHGVARDFARNVHLRLESNLKKGLATQEECDAFQALYDNYLSNRSSNKPVAMVMTNMQYATPQNDLSGLSKEELEQINYNADSDDSYDERSEGETLRGKETFMDRHNVKIKKIIGYKYNVLIRDEKALKGEFTREEMDKVYQLYSNMDGAGMTLRTVSREFPHLTFRDFKRILRAFNITKASLPIAPHTLEEMPEEELISSIRRNKENSILKRLDNDRLKYYEKRFFESQRQIVDLQSEEDGINKVIDNLLKKYTEKIGSKVKVVKKDAPKLKDKNNKQKVGKCVFSIFGDVHYGKKFANPIFGRGYDKDIAHERMLSIAKTTVEEIKNKNSNEVVMLCMGDLLESAIESGMHPGHYSEMDLHQDDQIFFAFDSMREMVEYVIEHTDAKITFGLIQGNHDRIGIKRDEDKNRTAGKIVSRFLKTIIEIKYPKRVEFIIPSNNLFKLIKGNLCIFAQHGDSSLSKKKPSELLTLWGEGNNYYHVFFRGHWHFLKTEEGTNNISIQVPSVTSTDKYIMEELGNNNLPGFIIGNEPEQGRGFDFKKITLY